MPPQQNKILARTIRLRLKNAALMKTFFKRNAKWFAPLSKIGLSFFEKNDLDDLAARQAYFLGGLGIPMSAVKADEKTKARLKAFLLAPPRTIGIKEAHREFESNAFLLGLIIMKKSEIAQHVRYRLEHGLTYKQLMDHVYDKEWMIPKLGGDGSVSDFANFLKGAGFTKADLVILNDVTTPKAKLLIKALNALLEVAKGFENDAAIVRGLIQEF